MNWSLIEYIRDILELTPLTRCRFLTYFFYQFKLLILIFISKWNDITFTMNHI
jgi:hypothetical protein